MTQAAEILVVDDEANLRKVLAALLEQAGYSVCTASTGGEALEKVRTHDPDLVLSDLRMPGMDGLELLSALRAGFPEIPVVLLTAHGTIDVAVESMKRGAHDFLTKPFEKLKVLSVIDRALEQGRRARAEHQGPLAPAAPCGLIGESAAIEDLRRTIRKVAPTPATVLIVGETGTGKELVAEALHGQSSRSAGPLVRINCGALPPNLVEAELFGHERGAFTGADRSRPGRFELADGGTLFLDEIGEMPIGDQVKLLRVLQDGLVHRVGAARPLSVDVRLLAATNRDLEDEARKGRFREDLLYRLRIVEIQVPPLRERIQDVPLLVESFLDKHAGRLLRPRPTVTPEAVAWLSSRAWPGNVRQLENAVERALLLAEGPSLEPADFGLAGEPEPAGVKEVARAAAAEAQRRMITAALESTGHNVTRAAAALGLSRRGLQIKMKELGLRSPTA